ncbi:hypothetical protein [Oceanihabitans sediminis]|uniref:hypothetical protein n=1 Tax=Oceanihabitans sediminis TaxID=1812012 RepID=UPI003A90BC7B
MNIYITLDYELFFGSQSGGIDDCIINPTKELLKIVDPLNVKIVFFVDVGYIDRLNKFKDEYPELQEDYIKITSQIKSLADNGHGIELHIHPHWENTIYNGEKWVFDTSLYKLQDFSKEEAYTIVTKYTKLLNKLSGKKAIAYRAGGWSSQPFSHISEALKDAGILIDSTVYPKGYHQSKHQAYDFRNVAQYKTKYSFSNDLTIEVSNGHFTEYPISSYRLSPFFFWRFALEKIKKNKKHIAFGNGSAISKPFLEVIKLMSWYSNSVVSIDGYKASFVSKAFNKYIKNTKNKGHFVLIGHPKAFTPFSLNETRKFIEKTYKEHTYSIFKKDSF